MILWTTIYVEKPDTTRHRNRSKRRDSTLAWRCFAPAKTASNRWVNLRNYVNFWCIRKYSWLCLFAHKNVVDLPGPEIDEEDVDEVESSKPSHGIDDGFFDDKHVLDGRGTVQPFPDKPRRAGGSPRRGSIPAVFPFPPPDYGGPGVVNIHENYNSIVINDLQITIPLEPRITPDINVYQHKKTLGMLALS